MPWPKGRRQTSEHTAKSAAGNRGAKRSPEACQRIREGIRLHRDTPEYRAKLSYALKGNSNCRGRIISLETCKKISESTLRNYRENPTLKEILRGNQWALGYKHTDEAKAKIRAASSRAFRGHKHTAATKERLREARLHRTMPTKMTSIERSLCSQFKKRRLKFEMHKTMFGRFQPDFVFEAIKLIVEADGDYWHRQLKRNHRLLADAATSHGWTVWRFAESEILQHPEACGRAVARFVRSH